MNEKSRVGRNPQDKTNRKSHDKDNKSFLKHSKEPCLFL